MDPILETKELTYSYDGDDAAEKRLVLNGIDLAVERGSFVAVLGHNGSGKSTLARHFNGLFLPLGGAVYVDGIDTAAEETIYELRRRVGMVFQNPDNQIIASLVEEDVAFGPENLGVPREEIVRRVDEALASVGMTELRSHAPHLLSGGQKQRVAIAGVLAMRPECVVLDEPTAMLDPSGREDVLDTVERLRAEYGLTVVLITHHMSEAARADRVVVLSEGRVCLDGTPREVLTDVDALRAVGLDAPSPVLLALALRRRGADVGELPLTEEECADRIARWLETEKERV